MKLSSCVRILCSEIPRETAQGVGGKRERERERQREILKLGTKPVV